MCRVRDSEHKIFLRHVARSTFSRSKIMRHMSQLGANWGSSNIAEDFKIFQQMVELHFQVKKTAKEFMVPNLLLATGAEGLRRFNSWTLTEEQRKDVQVVFKKFLEQLEPPENFRMARLTLSKFQQQSTENIDEFVTDANCKQRSVISL